MRTRDEIDARDQFIAAASQSLTQRRSALASRRDGRANGRDRADRDIGATATTTGRDDYEIPFSGDDTDACGFLLSPEECGAGGRRIAGHWSRRARFIADPYAASGLRK